jgi:hypothetical protein
MGLIVGGVAMIESAGRCPAANSRSRYGRRSSVWIYPRPTINPPPADFLLLQMRYPSLLRGWRWLWLGCVVLEQRRRRGCGPPHQRQFSEHSAEAVPCRAPNSSTLFPRRPSIIRVVARMLGRNPRGRDCTLDLSRCARGAVEMCRRCHTF